MCLLVASVVLRQRMGVGHITLPYKYKYEGLQVRGSSGVEAEEELEKRAAARLPPALHFEDILML